MINQELTIPQAGAEVASPWTQPRSPTDRRRLKIKLAAYEVSQSARVGRGDVAEALGWLERSILAQVPQRQWFVEPVDPLEAKEIDRGNAVALTPLGYPMLA